MKIFYKFVNGWHTFTTSKDSEKQIKYSYIGAYSDAIKQLKYRYNLKSVTIIKS